MINSRSHSNIPDTNRSTATILSEFLKSTYSVLNRQPDSLRLLDLGCGISNKLDRYASNPDVLYVGMDIDIEALKIAKQRFPNRLFIVADMNHLPFANASFNSVFGCSVLQYVDYHVVFNKVMDLLQAEGTGIFFVNRKYNPVALLIRMWYSLPGNGYKQFFQPVCYFKHDDLQHLHKQYHRSFMYSRHIFTPFLHAIAEISSQKTGYELFSDHLYNLLNHFERFLMRVVPVSGHLCWMSFIAVRKEQ